MSLLCCAESDSDGSLHLGVYQQAPMVTSVSKSDNGWPCGDLVVCSDDEAIELGVDAQPEEARANGALGAESPAASLSPRLSGRDDESPAGSLSLRLSVRDDESPARSLGPRASGHETHESESGSSLNADSSDSESPSGEFALQPAGSGCPLRAGLDCPAYGHCSQWAFRCWIALYATMGERALRPLRRPLAISTHFSGAGAVEVALSYLSSAAKSLSMPPLVSRPCFATEQNRVCQRILQQRLPGACVFRDILEEIALREGDASVSDRLTAHGRLDFDVASRW